MPIIKRLAVEPANVAQHDFDSDVRAQEVSE